MAEKTDTLRVIIAGAGIAGLATAISLSRISAIANIDIQLYEQAPELLEIGASIALSPNVRMLSSSPKICLTSSAIRECAHWKSSGWIKLSQMRLATGDQVESHRYSGIIILSPFSPRYHSSLIATRVCSHWKTEQVISVDTHTNVPNPRHHTTRFHRGHLHAALLEHVPRKSIHLEKKLTHVEAHQNGVILHFEDGSSAQGDILIGADGIRSVGGNLSSNGWSRTNLNFRELDSRSFLTISFASVERSL